MDGVKSYIGNIFCIYIIMSVIRNVVSNEKYARYFKLFCGTVMIMVVAGPLINLISGEDFSQGGLLNYDCEISDDVYASILSAERGRNDEIINLYCDSVTQRVQSYIENTQYGLISCDVKLNLDEESENYGNILMLDIVLNKNTDMYNDTGAKIYDYSIVTLKNNVANFYNIPSANIYINIYDGQDNKEGTGN